jgi:hypothetical protein
MTSNPEGGRSPEPPPVDGWRFVAIPALVALLVTSLALASPRTEPKPATPAPAALSSSAPVLPPGHPPIAGLCPGAAPTPGAPLPAFQLPPGHPPIGAGGPIAPPLAPSFEPPATVDI